MNILVTGATGFIGRHIVARLMAGGHGVVAAVRDVESARRRFPGIRAMRIDMNRMTLATDWTPLLKGIDAVVNCAGILRSGRGQDATAIHFSAPKALFTACVSAHVRRVIQISAVSADNEAGTEYALTKKAADDYLRGLDLDWVVLRPSLVYAHGSYGGTSAIRGLAGLPWVIPLIGQGEQEFQPIHADDLAETVAHCVIEPTLTFRTLEPVGPDTMSFREILELTRAWLDFPAARMVAVPMKLVRWAARIGDIVGAGPVSTVALDQIEYGNVSDPLAFQASIGFRPRSMRDSFRFAPSYVQDRWHARLYFVGPMLTVALCLLWFGSGLVGLADVARTAIPARLIDSLSSTAYPMAVGSSLADILLGMAIAIGWKPRLIGFLQFLIVAGYTLGIGFLAPYLWLDPFGSLLKNLPILAAILIWTALRDSR